MARHADEKLHKAWLGEAQPAVGATFSVPVLCDAQRVKVLSSAQLQTVAGQLEACSLDAGFDLRRLAMSLLQWPEAAIVEGEQLPPEMSLPSVGGSGRLRPSFALMSAADAAQQRCPRLLAWVVADGADLDRPDALADDWHYPPVAKFERLLRACKVDLGLLSNGREIRLLYCPAGQSSGWLSFHVAAMVSPAGRAMASAFCSLLHADCVLGSVGEQAGLLELLQRSRARQADVSAQLGRQLLEALQILLQGFEAAAVRDASRQIEVALERADNHVYEGLLTAMLRLVFVVYAEDRGLLPAEDPQYHDYYSIRGLYEQLRDDRALHGEAVESRMGAWHRLLALFRGLWTGLAAPGFDWPAHRGRLFDPDRFAFLEGRGPTDDGPERVPSISDAVVLRVLERLLQLDGQRLSYAALDEEQLGSVYEGLMGFRVERRTHASLCLRPSRVWVSPAELLDVAAGGRARWLHECGLPMPSARRLATAIDAQAETDGDPTVAVLELLRKESVAPAAVGGSEAIVEVAAGRWVIQPGDERRRTSSHYTPRSLSGPIVRRTLDPVLRASAGRGRAEDAEPQPSSRALLSLRVCDPAMGSGAFLVEACRYLADLLVAAWTREGALAEHCKLPGSDATIDPVVAARRMVAQCCLFGVDKNPLAVELAKLSLWLLTLSRGQSFAFLDHRLRAGDSLVGLTRSELWALDWTAQDDAHSPEVGQRLDEDRARVVRLRTQLIDTALHGGEALPAELARMHAEAEAALDSLRATADAVISGHLFPEDDALDSSALSNEARIPAGVRRAQRAKIQSQLAAWLTTEADWPETLERRRKLVRDHVGPFHWQLEFAEVFEARECEGLSRRGFDAIVGNPPFLGGRYVSQRFGHGYNAWLCRAPEAKLAADLCAHFFRLALALLEGEGCLGLICPSTITTDSNRKSSIESILAAGGKLYDVRHQMTWPGTANVIISTAVAALGQSMADLAGPPQLGGRVVQAINAKFQARGSDEAPTSTGEAEPGLLSGAGELCYQGSNLRGRGFVVDAAERARLLAADPTHAAHIKRYIDGDVVRAAPAAPLDKYTIDVGELELDQVQALPALYETLSASVRVQRSEANQKTAREQWWRYWNRRPGLYRALAPLERCIVTVLVCTRIAFEFVPSRQCVFGHKLAVFALDRNWHLGLLQSRIHGIWARCYSGARGKKSITYAPTKCFETFAPPVAWQAKPPKALEQAALAVIEARKAAMLEWGVGVYEVYKRLEDPESDDLGLRALHEQLDRAVLAAYGSSGVEVPSYVGASEAQLRRFETEVLAVLRAANLRSGPGLG